MKCPHCGHNHSRITDTRSVADGTLRRRMCLGCAKGYTTMERVTVWVARESLHRDLTTDPPVLYAVPDAVEARNARRAKPKAARYQAKLGGDLLGNICFEAQPLLVQWWNESRWSKHKAKATWTEAAWLSSVSRVSRLPRELQLQLAKAGVEHGWQSLKVEYLDRYDLAAAAGPRPTPTDPAMREALASW